MGWFARRRARRQAELASACAAAVGATKIDPKEEMLTVIKLLNEITAGRLAAEKQAQQFELERLRVTESDRKADREFELKHKEENRKARADAAAAAREALKRKKLGAGANDVPAELRACEDCRAKLEGREAAHNRDMVNHAARGHKRYLDTILARRQERPGGSATAGA